MRTRNMCNALLKHAWEKGHLPQWKDYKILVP